MTMPNVADFPRPSEFWKRPPKTTSGDTSSDPIHFSVGRALSGWESLEALYAGIFARLVLGYGRGYPDDGAKRAFGAMRDSQTRAWAMQAAGDVFFAMRPDQDLERELDSLRKHYLAGCEWRNEIAHGMTVSLQQAGHFLVPSSHNPRQSGSWLAETMRAIGKPAAPPGDDPLAGFHFDYRYTSDQILDFATRCGGLQGAAMGFDMRLNVKAAAG